MKLTDAESRKRASELALAWNRAHPERKRANSRAYYHRRKGNPNVVAAETNRKLLARYHISLEERDAMFGAQDGKCAICKADISGYKASNVDHDHKTGQVRELLCGICNRMAGVLEHERAPSIEAYLSKHRQAKSLISFSAEETLRSLPLICSAYI